jgi:translation initiation factor 1A
MSQKKEELERQEQIQQEIRRIKLPRGKECFGILEQRLGASRLRVKCLDGQNRVCRIPGRLKRKLWVRENDIVVVEPWEFGGDDKGDIVFKYTPSQVEFLRSRGYLKKIEEVNEF